MKIRSLITLFLFFSIVAIGQIKNTNFENWHTIPNIPNAEDPDFWTSTNIMPPNTGFNLGITKSTDAYEGNYALKIMPKRFQPSHFWLGDTTGSVISYGISNPTALLHDGGFYIKDTVVFIPSKLTGYYKRIKTNYTSIDTAYIKILLNNIGTVFGFSRYGESGFSPTTTYQYFEVDILGDPRADSIGISIFYESNDTSSTNGGYLLIDDLGIEPLVSTDDLKDVSIKVYPNPSSDYLYIEQGENKRIERIELFDLQGRLMKSVDNIQQSQQKIDIRALERGYYMMRITSEQGIGVKKILIE